MIESRGIRNKKSFPSFFMYRQPQDTDRDFQSRFRSQVKEKNEMLRLEESKWDVTNLKGEKTRTFFPLFEPITECLFSSLSPFSRLLSFAPSLFLSLSLFDAPNFHSHFSLQTKHTLLLGPIPQILTFSSLCRSIWIEMEENKNFSQTSFLWFSPYEWFCWQRLISLTGRRRIHVFVNGIRNGHLFPRNLSLSLSLSWSPSPREVLLIISSFTPSLGVGYLVVRQKPYFTINKRQSSILPSSPSTCPISEVVLLETSSSDEQSRLDTKQMAILEKVTTNEERVRHRF